MRKKSRFELKKRLLMAVSSEAFQSMLFQIIWNFAKLCLHYYFPHHF